MTSQTQSFAKKPCFPSSVVDSSIFPSVDEAAVVVAEQSKAVFNTTETVVAKLNVIDKNIKKTSY